MKKRHQGCVTKKEQNKKHHHAKQKTCFINDNSRSHSHTKFGTPQNWYQQRKRAQQHLANLSKGHIILFSSLHSSSVYYGHHIRHWMQDLRCKHLFKASLKQVAAIGAHQICPFCNTPIDMTHYGSVGAVAEHVHELSFGNIHFFENNLLGSVNDYYQMVCLIHGHRFENTFSAFLANPLHACPFCLLDHG